MLTIKSLDNKIEARLIGMVDRAKGIRSLLNRQIYGLYQDVQRKRWMTESDSEGKKWNKLNSTYAKRKLVKYASYPGAGRKMMIATGRLYKSVIGPSPDHRKIVEEKKLIVSTVVPYAKYADEARSFTHFSDATMMRVKKILADYILRGKS